MIRGRPPLRGRGRTRASAGASAGSGEQAPAGRGGGEQVNPQPPGNANAQPLEAEVAELRGQLTTLTQMFQQFLQQQQTAATTPPVPPPAPTAPVTEDPPATPAPATAPTGTTAPAATTSSTEGARIRERLAEFRKFEPPKFEGRKEDKGMLEFWIMDMEKLFRDLHIEEQDRVPLAAHCLGREANAWWYRHFTKKLGGIYPSWEGFRGFLYEQYFKDSSKRDLERELERLKQGNRTVAEYEQDFSRIIGMIPFAVHDDYHKARLFMRGLRPNLRMLVASNGAINFDDCLDRALILQSEQEDVRADREASERSGDRKRSHDKSNGGSSFSERPPKHQRNQQSARSTPSSSQRPGGRPCVICGQAHKVMECPQRWDHCFQCGQPGHLRAQCPRRGGTNQSTASSPVAPRQNRGTSSAAASSGRPSSSRQDEGARPASGGRVFSLTQQDENIGGDVLAGIVTLSITRARALFDTGASYSFLSHSFACEHGIPLRPLGFELRIDTPGGDLVAEQGVSSYPVKVVSERSYNHNTIHRLFLKSK